jgi:hypothetical protein
MEMLDSGALNELKEGECTGERDEAHDSAFLRSVMMEIPEDEANNGSNPPRDAGTASVPHDTERAAATEQQGVAHSTSPEPYLSACSFPFPLQPATNYPSAPVAAVHQRPLDVEPDSNANGWHLPPGVAESLYAVPVDERRVLADSIRVEIFFEKVHPWIPIFHRPQFYQKHMHSAAPRTTVTTRGSATSEEALIFNCIFAFAARFSSSAYFESVSPRDRGAVFADRATALHDELLRAVEEPSLDYIKGCTLLAAYLFSAASCPRGSLLTGICIRLAYDLGLNSIDDESRDECIGMDCDNTSVEDWIRKEELRRVWWAIWELDTFGSTIACQPYGLDKRRIQVHLPVPDRNWFSGTPVASSPLGPRPGTAWKALKDSPNQDERAWFLISNYLMACAHDVERQPSGVSPEGRAELEHALGCFNLTLPSHFHLGSFYFDHEHVAQSNYILSTHMMLLV